MEEGKDMKKRRSVGDGRKEMSQLNPSHASHRAVTTQGHPHLYIQSIVVSTTVYW